jgi:hypothetical protein
VTYSGPDSAAATVTVSCSDAAGNVAARTVTLQYDATPPTVSPAPSRPPDADGWYNHPFDLAFQGSDAVSGVDSCASASYSGPNAEAATLTGTCRDKAGNEAAPVSFGFKYDSTPPRLAKLSVQSLDKAVTMRWTASADVAEITIVRTRTGVGRAVTVYAGKPLTAFVDRHVQNGKRYTYLVAALDQAGNQVAGRAVAAPDAPLLAPRRGKRVHRATTLRWRPVPRASYYNVQLWRGRSKVLTTWPKGTKLRLDALPPGAYTWFVWPGRGPRAKHRYGALLGRSTFVVTG